MSEQQIDWNKEHGNFPWRRIAIVSLALIAAVVVVVFLVVFPQFRPVEGGSGTPAHETASVATGLIPDPPKKLEEKLISTTALDLWSEYDANEVLADRKYKGRLLSITGSISSIDKDYWDNPYVSLHGNDFIGTVRCSFSKNQEDILAGLSKGQFVTMAGRCDGRLIGDPQIKTCNIVQP